jgi:opacity protein-like surface antigen
MSSLKINTVPLLAASFFALAASSANATDLLDGLNDPAPQGTAVNWTGPYIALGMGYEAFRSESTETYYEKKPCVSKGPCDPHKPIDISQQNFDGKAIVTGRIGYDQQSGGAVYGAFVEGNWLNLESALGDAEWSYGAGARVGLLCGGALCYINGGWEFIELEDESIDNPFAGGGLEVSFGDGWGGALEGRYSFRDDNEGGVDVKDVVSGRLMLIKKFQ